MTGERFLIHLHRKPFVPFVIHVADGARITVKSPEYVVPNVVRERNREGVRTIEVNDSASQTWETIDLLLVTRLSVVFPQD